MNEQTLITVVSFIFSAGVVYGALNNRIKVIEKNQQDFRETGERLARIEEKTNLLVDHFIKK